MGVKMGESESDRASRATGVDAKDGVRGSPGSSCFLFRWEVVSRRQGGAQRTPHALPESRSPPTVPPFELTGSDVPEFALAK